jgi:transposase InsO family protein
VILLNTTFLTSATLYPNRSARMGLLSPLDWTNSQERDLQLSPWLQHYNFTRPHGRLGYAPPISRAAPASTTS